MSDVKVSRRDEALCPGCGKPGRATHLSGWRFHCKPCNWRWGHPQSLTTDEAVEAAAEARLLAGVEE